MKCSASRKLKVSFNQKCKREQCAQDSSMIFLERFELNWRSDARCSDLDRWFLGQLQLLTKSARVWKELPFVGHLYVPLCLAESPRRVAIYIYWAFSQLHCCTWLVPELKLNDGWHGLSDRSIVHGNRCRKVGLDRSLKYQPALLFSFLFEIFFALACVSMSVVMWCATQTWVVLGGLPPWRKKGSWLPTKAHHGLTVTL